LIVMILAVDGIETDVPQRVIHPPHVPLQSEAESSKIRRPRNARP
jgi:hypothetical protein